MAFEQLSQITRTLRQAATPQQAGQALIDWLAQYRGTAGLIFPQGLLRPDSRTLSPELVGWMKNRSNWMMMDAPHTTETHIFVPLRYGGRVQGVLALEQSEAKAETVLLAEVLAARLDELYTAQITLGSRKLAQALNQAQHTSALLREAVEKIASIFDFQAAMVYRFEADSHQGEVIAEYPTRVALGRNLERSDYALFHKAFKQQGSIRHPSDGTAQISQQLRLMLRTGGYQQFLAVPMYSKGRVIGALAAYLALTPQQRQFTGRESELLHLLAQVLANAYSMTRQMRQPATAFDPAFFQQLVDQANVAIDILDKDGKVLYHNNFWHEVYKQNDGRPQHLSDRLLETEQGLVKRLIFPQSAHRQGWSNYITLRRGDGSRFDAQLSVVALRNDQDQIVGYSTITNDVSELHYVMDAVQHQTLRLAAASIVSQAIIANQDLKMLLEQVTRLICEQFGFAGAQVIGTNDEQEEITCLMACDANGQILHDRIDACLPLQSDSVLRAVLEQGEPLIIPDIETETRFRPSAFGDATGSEMVVLLKAPDVLLGVLSVQSLQKNQFGPDDLDILQSLADQLAIAIYNARLFQNLTARVHDITVIAEVSLLVQTAFELDELVMRLHEAIQWVNQHGNFTFALSDERQQHVQVRTFVNGRQHRQRRAIDDDLLSQMVKQGTALFWRTQEEQVAFAKYFDLDVSQVPPSFLGLPLIAKDQVLGAIYLESEASYAFDDNDLKLLLNLANSAAFAIENMRLFKSLQQRLDEMQAINNISHLLASSFGGSALWNPLLEEMRNLFPDDVIAVSLYNALNDTLYEPELRGLELHLSPAPEALSRAVLSNGITLHFDDLHAEDARLQSLGIEPAIYNMGLLRSWLGTPLRSRNNEAIGVLCLQSDRPNKFVDRDTALLNTLAAQVSLALENGHLLAAEQHRRDVSRTLIDVGRVVSSTLDLEEVLDLILEQLARVVQYNRALILMPLQPETVQTMQIHAYVGFFPMSRKQQLQLDLKSPLAHIAITQQPLNIADVQGDARWQWQPKLIREGQVKSWLGAPMVIQSRVIGLIMVDQHMAHAYDEDDAQTIFALARQAAIAVDNANLHQQVARNLRSLEVRARRLASMHRMASIVNSSLSQEEILSQAAKMLKELFSVDHVSIVLMNPHDEQGYLEAEYPDMDLLGEAVIVKGTSSHQTMQRILQDNQVLHIHLDESERGAEATETNVLAQIGVRTALFAPMKVHGNILGGIGLGSFDPDRNFSVGDRDAFMTIAVQIGMALRNAELYAEAVEANRLKSEFLANVSHELRTPLNAIMGYSELLLNGTYGELDARQIDRLRRVHDSGQSLLHLINDILDLSKIEAGRMDLKPVRLNLAALIQEAIAAFSQQIEDKGLKLQTHIESNPPSLQGDVNRIRQVLNNLVSNAIKFTHSGTVTITLQTILLAKAQSKQLVPGFVDAREGTWLLVRIHDTGIGISKAHQAIIFAAFRQADGSSVREYEGAGLGLAITQRLVQMHGGYIWVDSKLGQGSSFSFILPTRTSSRRIHFNQDRTDERPLVLVFAEEAAQLELLESYLNEAAYRVTPINDASPLFQSALQFQPLAIVMDVSVSAAQGWDVLRQLKQEESTAQIPILVVSTLEEQTRALRLGITHFLHRPFTKADLRQALQAVIDAKPAAPDAE